jgi:hypothetical protein
MSNIRPLSLAGLSRIGLVTLALNGVIPFATAQSNPESGQSPAERRLAPINATRLVPGEKIHLDGRLDEPLWARVPAHREFYEYRPRDGVAAKYPSEFRIAYDDHALYIALTAHDPDPSLIDAPFVRRDKVGNAHDFFFVEIDPVGNRKFAQFFQVGASGALGDGLQNEDTGNEDDSPDFEWDARTARTSTGWTAEMRIPFATLRYSDPPSENWSILVVRGIARDQVYRFVNARVPRNQNCFMCYAQTLGGMKELPAGRELTVTPQLTLRRATDITNGADSRKTDFVAGVDVKFRPRPDMVFDATINPDFSQVELDTPQLAANAQFALFFQEKRPFFLEGADILASPFSAIYTRSITDPAWGARLTQRNDGNDFIFLTTRDDGKGLILLPNALNTNVAVQDSKSQATIGRFRVNRGNWTFAGLVSDRTYERTAGKPVMYNRVAGLDFVWRPLGEMRVRGQLLESSTHDDRNAGLMPAGGRRNDEAALLDYNFSNAKWNLSGGTEYVGKGFRADNGFFSQSGYLNAYQNIQRKFLEVGPFIEVSPTFNLARKTDSDGRLLYQQAYPGLWLSLPRNTSINIELRPNGLIRYREDGKPLKRDQFFISVESNPGTILSSIYAELATGDRSDVANNRIGKGYYFGANALLRLSDRWELEPRIDNSVINPLDGRIENRRTLLERAVQLKSVYHFTARDNVRIIGQYNSVRRAISQFQSPASPFEKSEILSLVYGHRRGLGTNFYVGATTSRSIDPAGHYHRHQNEIFVKWSWAFDLTELH